MLKIETLKSPHPFAANTYLISSAGEYAVIDPTAPFEEKYIDGGVLKYVLLTHAHFDHILEIDSWAGVDGARVILSNDEVGALPDPMRNCYKLYNGTDNGYFGVAEGLNDGDAIPLGNEKIRIISCPGHTVGSASFLCGEQAFVGDTVFEGGGIGRYDLPTGNWVMLKDSIRKIISLPDETVLYPGHGEKTTVKQYKNDMNFTHRG